MITRSAESECSDDDDLPELVKCYPVVDAPHKNAVISSLEFIMLRHMVKERRQLVLQLEDGLGASWDDTNAVVIPRHRGHTHEECDAAHRQHLQRLGLVAGPGEEGDDSDSSVSLPDLDDDDDSA